MTQETQTETPEPDTTKTTAEQPPTTDIEAQRSHVQEAIQACLEAGVVRPIKGHDHDSKPVGIMFRQNPNMTEGGTSIFVIDLDGSYAAELTQDPQKTPSLSEQIIPGLAPYEVDSQSITAAVSEMSRALTVPYWDTQTSGTSADDRSLIAGRAAVRLAELHKEALEINSAEDAVTSIFHAQLTA